MPGMRGFDVVLFPVASEGEGMLWYVVYFPGSVKACHGGADTFDGRTPQMDACILLNLQTPFKSRKECLRV